MEEGGGRTGADLECVCTVRTYGREGGRLTSSPRDSIGSSQKEEEGRGGGRRLNKKEVRLPLSCSHI